MYSYRRGFILTGGDLSLQGRNHVYRGGILIGGVIPQGGVILTGGAYNLTRGGGIIHAGEDLS